MASIYDIAKLAGVSYSTVSLILNNRGDDLRISKKTQEKVKQIAKEQGYVPNVHARKLISKDIKNIPEIALFWSPTQHPIFLNSMISKLNEMMNEGIVPDMSVTIYPFENDHLDKMEKILKGNFVHGIIIPVAEEKDIRYLRQLDIQVPVITIYRSARKYHSVDVDNYTNGKVAGEIFHMLGMKRVGILRNAYSSISFSERVKGFKEQCRKNSMEIIVDLDRNISKKKSKDPVERYQVGSQIAEEILAAGQAPEGLFVQNDDSARGAVHTFKKHGIRVPEDIAVIAYGHNSNENAEESRLTLISFPMDELAEKTWQLIGSLLSGGIIKTTRVLCPSRVFFGASCPKPEAFDEWMQEKGKVHKKE